MSSTNTEYNKNISNITFEQIKQQNIDHYKLRQGKLIPIYKK